MLLIVAFFYASSITNSQSETIGGCICMAIIPDIWQPSSWFDVLEIIVILLVSTTWWGLENAHLHTPYIDMILKIMIADTGKITHTVYTLLQ